MAKKQYITKSAEVKPSAPIVSVDGMITIVSTGKLSFMKPGKGYVTSLIHGEKLIKKGYAKIKV